MKETVFPITEEEIEFAECFYTPTCLSECLFSDGDDLTAFDDRFIEVRAGQIPMLSFEFLIDFETGLTRKQGMMLREGAGSVYAFGGRNYGKTWTTEKLDILLTLICLDGQQMGLSSYDFSHITNVILPVTDALEYHPIIKYWKRSVRGSPDYVIRTHNGNQLNSINMNIKSRDSGHQFFQKHLHKLWIEEASFETEEVYKKRIDARHELGCVERLSGMTNFTQYSPAGKVFYAEEEHMRNRVCNLPQYVNPNFDEQENKKAIRKHGGKLSLGYRVFVKGEIVTEAVATFDMARVSECYNENKVSSLPQLYKEDLSFIPFSRLSEC